MYLIIYGATSCSDVDVNNGYVETKDTAENLCKRLNAHIKVGVPRAFAYEEVAPVSDMTDSGIDAIVNDVLEPGCRKI